MDAKDLVYYSNWALDNLILVSFLLITFLVWVGATISLLFFYQPVIKDLKEIKQAVEKIEVGYGMRTRDAIQNLLATRKSSRFNYYVFLFKYNVSGYVNNDIAGFGSAILYDALSFENFEVIHLRESSMAFLRSLLIALGVIGTFAGLIVGISGASEGLASTDAITARMSLQDLLSGAGLAFITSIAGLCFSTLFGIQHQRKYNLISTTHRSFITALTCRIVPKSEISSILEVRDQIEILNEKSQKQLEIMQSLCGAVNNLSDSINKQSGALVNQDKETMEELLRESKNKRALLENSLHFLNLIGNGQEKFLSHSSEVKELLNSISLSIAASEKSVGGIEKQFDVSAKQSQNNAEHLHQSLENQLHLMERSVHFVSSLTEHQKELPSNLSEIKKLLKDQNNTLAILCARLDRIERS